MQIPAENRAGRVIAGFSATVRHRSILDGSEVVHRIIDEKLWQNFKEGGWGELQHFERFGRSSDDMPDEGDDHSTGGTPGLKDLFVGQDNKGARRDYVVEGSIVELEGNAEGNTSPTVAQETPSSKSEPPKIQIYINIHQVSFNSPRQGKMKGRR